MLTEVQIKNARPRDRGYKLKDDRGLYLLVTPSGSRLWRLRYWIDGRESMLSLGAYPDISLREARDARDDARKLVGKKRDPVAARREERAARADTFGQVASEWRAQQADLAPKTLRVIDWQLDLILPRLKGRPVADITAKEVLDLLQKLDARGKVVARRARQRIGQILRYAGATQRVHVDVTSLLRGALKSRAAEKHPGLSAPQEVGELLRRIPTLEGEPATIFALRILPHVFLRPGELRKARWDWLRGAELHCPAKVMKLRRPHVVPLSRQVLAMLGQLQLVSGEGEWMFPGTRDADHLGPGTFNPALRRLGYDTLHQHCAHGFRTTASTLLNSLGWDRDWIELQLAHVDGSVRGIYNEAQWLPQRAAMLQAWSDYLEALTSLGAAGDAAALERCARLGRPATHASTSLLNHPTLPPSSSTD